MVATGANLLTARHFDRRAHLDGYGLRHLFVAIAVDLYQLFDQRNAFCHWGCHPTRQGSFGGGYSCIGIGLAAQ